MADLGKETHGAQRLVKDLRGNKVVDCCQKVCPITNDLPETTRVRVSTQMKIARHSLISEVSKG